MARDDADLSELEREFELEMEEEPSAELELGTDEEFEAERDDRPGAFESSDPADHFADRFYELSQGSYESEFELDEDVNRLVGDMEREFFFKSIGRRLKGAGKGLLKKGLRLAAGQVPALKALQAVTQLSRGNLKGLLGSLAKAGLASAIPGGAAALPALKALGFEADDPGGNRDAWKNYTQVSREAFEYLASNLNETADSPLEASRLATAAFQTALRRAQDRMGANGRPRVDAVTRSGARVISLRRGERIVIRAV